MIGVRLLVYCGFLVVGGCGMMVGSDVGGWWWKRGVVIGGLLFV